MKQTTVAVLISAFFGIICCQNVITGRQFPLDINFGEDIGGGQDELFSLLGLGDTGKRGEKTSYKIISSKNYQDILADLLPKQVNQKQQVIVPNQANQKQNGVESDSQVVLLRTLPYALNKKLAQDAARAFKTGPAVFADDIKTVPKPVTHLVPPPEHRVNNIPVSPPDFNQPQVQSGFAGIKNDQPNPLNDNNQEIISSYLDKRDNSNKKQNGNQQTQQNKNNEDALSYSSYVLSNEKDLQKLIDQNDLVQIGFKHVPDNKQNQNNKNNNNNHNSNDNNNQKNNNQQQNNDYKPKTNEKTGGHKQNNINVNLDSLGEVLSFLRINPDGTEESAIISNKGNQLKNNNRNQQPYLKFQQDLNQNQKNSGNNQGGLVKTQEKLVENIGYLNQNDAKLISNVNKKENLNDDLVSSLEIVNNFFKSQDELNKKILATNQLGQIQKDNSYTQNTQNKNENNANLYSNQVNYDISNDQNKSGRVLNNNEEKPAQNQGKPATVQTDSKDIFFISGEGLGRIPASANGPQKGFIVYFANAKGEPGKLLQPNQKNNFGGSATSYSRVSVPGRHYTNNLDH